MYRRSHPTISTTAVLSRFERKEFVIIMYQLKIFRISERESLVDLEGRVNAWLKTLDPAIRVVEIRPSESMDARVGWSYAIAALYQLGETSDAPCAVC